MRLVVDYRTTLKGLSALGRELANPTGLMRQIGNLIVAESHKAFTAQQFGPEKWPARYEGQEAPKLNIAGALTDFKAGRTAPKQKRFSDRPALVDLGMGGGLQGSIASRVISPFSFEIGTMKPYASLHQTGGVSSIQYDKGTRDRIKEWLYTKDTAHKKDKTLRTNKIPGTYGKHRRNEYEKHLKPLLYTSTWMQRVARRPFLGIHAQLEKDLLEAVKRYFEKRIRR